jgi:hypothetical protein
VTQHFRRIWARTEENFRETRNGSLFHLAPRVTDLDAEDMASYMLSEDNIAQVIKSRQDLSACGVDGINYRIMKGAGSEGVKFMK